MDSTNKVWVIVYRNIKDSFELLLLKPNPEPNIERDYYIITGGIEDNETPVAAAKRETIEEIGVEPNNVIDLDISFNYINELNGKIVNEKCFLAEVDRQVVIRLNEEHIAFKWVSIKDFGKNVWWVGSRKGLKELLLTVTKLIENNK